MSLNLRTAALLSLGNITTTVPLRMVLLESSCSSGLGKGDDEHLSWFWLNAMNWTG